MNDLTVEAVVDDFIGRNRLGTRGYTERGYATGTTGQGLLRCAVCRSVLYGGADTWAPGTPAYYSCTDCGKVSLPVSHVDAQLERLTQTRLEDPAFLERWRVLRAAELGERVERGLRLHAWCTDPGNRTQVRRANRVIRGSSLSWSTCQDALSDLTSDMTEWVAERAGHAGRDDDGASLAELRATRSRYRYLHVFSQRAWREMGSRFSAERRDLIREMGGEREFIAQLSLMESRLWDLLSRTRWRDADPVRQPCHDKALEQDWAKSSDTMVGRRRELVQLALGANHSLTVDANGLVHLVAG